MKNWIFLLTMHLFIGLYCYGDEKGQKTIKGKWQSDLIFELTEIDHVKVLSVSNNKEGQEMVLFEANINETELKELSLSIQIDEKRSGFHCMCNGDYLFKFYKNDKLVFTLGYHHGRSLRWHEGKWLGDALLTKKSQETLIQWFLKKGFNKLQLDAEKKTADKKQMEKEDEMFSSYFPAKVQGLLKLKGGSPSDRDEREKTLPNKISEAFNTKKELGVACCKAMGSSSMSSWTSTGDKERVVLAAGNMLSGEEFLAVLESLDKNNVGALRGAARYFFREGFNKKIPEKHAFKWSVELAKIELLANYDDNKSFLIRSLGKLNSVDIKKLLEEIAHEKIGKLVNPENIYDDEPAPYADAYLALANLGEKSFKKEMEEKLLKEVIPQNKAALEVCLVLLGEQIYISKNHFKFESYSIGYFAIKGIEKFKGKHGLDILVENGMNHPWGGVRDEAVLAIQRITSQKWYNGGNESPSRYKETIEKWWLENKSEILKKFQ
jgi:hypothetical protein